MRGSKIEERGDGFSVLAWTTDVSGKRRRRRISAKTRAELRRKTTAVLAASDRGVLADPGGLTVAQYLDGWLGSVSKLSRRGKPLAPTTGAGYALAVRHVTASIGQVKLRDLRPAHIEKLRDDLTSSGRMAPESVGHVLRIASAAFRRGVARGLLSRNPADAELVSRPAGKPKPIAIITPEKAEAILEAVRGLDPWDAAAHLALGVALRRSEILALRWDDVDLDAGLVHVRRAVTFADGKLHEGLPKSEAGNRTIALPSVVGDALKRHTAAQDRRRLIAGAAWTDLDLVVDSGVGGFCRPGSFSKAWLRFFHREGLGVTFHGLRHGAATLLLASGVRSEVALRIMGHADTRILARYQAIVPSLLDDAAARMGAVLGGARP